MHILANFINSISCVVVFVTLSIIWPHALAFVRLKSYHQSFSAGAKRFLRRKIIHMCVPWWCAARSFVRVCLCVYAQSTFYTVHMCLSYLYVCICRITQMYSVSNLAP